MSEIILTSYKIDKGQWVAFCETKTNVIVGIHEFKTGGEAKTALKLIIKPTKDELDAECSAEGFKYAEPKK
jgi:hypothetical protein